MAEYNGKKYGKPLSEEIIEKYIEALPPLSPGKKKLAEAGGKYFKARMDEYKKNRDVIQRCRKICLGMEDEDG